MPSKKPSHGIVEALLPLAVAIDSLTPDPHNARRHPSASIDAIAASLLRFGQRKPIVVQKDGLVVRAGNGLLEAARGLKWTHVAALVVDESDADATAFGLIDNRVPELSLWDMGALDVALAETNGALDVFGFDDLSAIPTSVAPETLVEHPRNYRGHPYDQVAHLKESLSSFGVYRNVVVSSDGVILAGHGVVKAARELKIGAIPVRRLSIHSTDPRALRIIAGDNEIARFAETDDRLLVQMLTELRDNGGLLGTGFDDMQLANLATLIDGDARPGRDGANEEWDKGGGSEFVETNEPPKLILSFKDPNDRDELIDRLRVVVWKKIGTAWSAPYPPREVEGTTQRFVEGGGA